MKRIISVVVTIFLILSLLNGCVFKSISPEEDLINMQLGGYLYTSQARAETKDERNMLKERKRQFHP